MQLNDMPIYALEELKKLAGNDENLKVELNRWINRWVNVYNIERTITHQDALHVREESFTEFMVRQLGEELAHKWIMSEGVLVRHHTTFGEKYGFRIISIKRGPNEEA